MYGFFAALWHLTLSMAPYLLLGFLIAGLLYAFVPGATFSRHLSRKGWRSVRNATLLGIPLPLCSCGVLPTTVSLRRSGASRGACTAFLISTPQTGVDSILATYSLLGPVFALLRIVVALITGILGGLLTDFVFRNEAVSASRAIENEASEKIGFCAKMKRAFSYAFGELLQDVGRWLVVGLLVAALVTVFVPADFFAFLQDRPLLGMLGVLLVAVPMYVCATGSIPIALSLMLKGMSPGTAFVLLMAGPAINAASMLVVGRAFGRKQMLVYMFSVVAGAILSGLLIDTFIPSSYFMPESLASASACYDCSEDNVSWWTILSGLLFAFLLLRALWLRHKGGSACGCGRPVVRHGEACGCNPSHDGCHDGEPSCSAQTSSSELILHINGLRCSHCAANVHSVLIAFPEIEYAEVSHTTGMARIRFVPGKTLPAERLRDAIIKAGYTIDSDMPK